MSLLIFGDEQFAVDLKAAVFYVLFKNKYLFDSLIRLSNPKKTFKSYIIETAQDNAWGDEIIILALSILTDRPVNIYSKAVFRNDNRNVKLNHFISGSISNNRVPLTIVFDQQRHHYVALLPNKESQMPPIIDENYFEIYNNLIKKSLL